MSLKCRFCCCGRNTTLFIVALSTLIQSIVMGTLSYLAILAYDCKMKMDGDPLSYAMYLIYFFNRQCGLVDWKNLGLQVPSSVQPLFNGNTSKAAAHTYTLAWLYLYFSAALFCGSVILLIGACMKSKSRCINFIVFWPWIITLTANIGLDVAGTWLYWIDVSNTGGVLKFLEFLEVLNSDEIFQYLPEYETHFTRLPSLVMMLVTSRLVIIFLANIWFLIITFLIYIEVNMKIGKDKKKARKEREALENLPVIVSPQRNIGFAAERTETAAATPPRLVSPKYGFENFAFEKELDSVVIRGLKHYETTGLSNVHKQNPEDDVVTDVTQPHMLTGPNYPELLKHEKPSTSKDF